MPLLVVPLAPEETDLLTLSEWDELVARDRVLFEVPAHPLRERLAGAGMEAGPFDDEPDAADDASALVAQPGSPRTYELARAGAELRVGPARPPDALAAAYAAPVVRRAAAALADLTAVMARLRGDEGCPWDRQQTHESLRVHLIEEAHEVLDAIDRGETGPGLEEELGDLLLQVAFHAELARQDGRFDISGVAGRIVAKLLHRHPHVFGEVTVSGAHEVVANWEALKAAEKRRDGPFDDIPPGLPALLATYKVQKRAARLGFSATAGDARDHLERALQGIADPKGVGEALFWLVALARGAGVDPEGALRAATRRFAESFAPEA